MRVVRVEVPTVVTLKMDPVPAGVPDENLREPLLPADETIGLIVFVDAAETKTKYIYKFERTIRFTPLVFELSFC